MSDTVLNPSNDEIETPLHDLPTSQSVVVRGSTSLDCFAGVPLEFEQARMKVAYGVGIGVTQNYSTGTLFLQIGPKASVRCVRLHVPKMANQKEQEQSSPVVAVIVQARRYWREYRPVYDPNLPRLREYDAIIGKPDEIPPQALADGLRGDWLSDPRLPARERGPTVAKALDLGMLVRRPAGVDDDVFCLKLGEHFYAPAWFLAEKANYPGINRAISTWLIKDANERGVSLADASISKHFSTFTSFASLDDGRVKTSLVLGKLTDNGKVVMVPDDFQDGLRRMLESAPKAEDDVPF